jgi:hypothetical protein
MIMDEAQNIALIILTTIRYELRKLQQSEDERGQHHALRQTRQPRYPTPTDKLANRSGPVGAVEPINP